MAMVTLSPTSNWAFVAFKFKAFVFNLKATTSRVQSFSLLWRLMAPKSEKDCLAHFKKIAALKIAAHFKKIADSNLIFKFESGRIIVMKPGLRG